MKKHYKTHAYETVLHHQGKKLYKLVRGGVTSFSRIHLSSSDLLNDPDDTDKAYSKEEVAEMLKFRTRRFKRLRQEKWVKAKFIEALKRRQINIA
jgi:hypothetical protein